MATSSVGCGLIGKAQPVFRSNFAAWSRSLIFVRRVRAFSSFPDSALAMERRCPNLKEHDFPRLVNDVLPRMAAKAAMKASNTTRRRISLWTDAPRFLQQFLEAISRSSLEVLFRFDAGTCDMVVNTGCSSSSAACRSRVGARRPLRVWERVFMRSDARKGKSVFRRRLVLPPQEDRARPRGLVNDQAYFQ